MVNGNKNITIVDELPTTDSILITKNRDMFVGVNPENLRN